MNSPTIDAPRAAAPPAPVPHRAVPIIAALVICAIFSSCGGVNLTALLQAIPDETAILITTLKSLAPSLNPATLTAITNVVAAIDTAVQETIPELASSDTTAVKASKIVGFFAAALSASKVLPPGTPTVILGIVAAVNVAIKAFLAELAPSKVALAPSKLKLKALDAQAVSYIAAKNSANIEALKAIRH